MKAKTPESCLVDSHSIMKEKNPQKVNPILHCRRCKGSLAYQVHETHENHLNADFQYLCTDCSQAPPDKRRYGPFRPRQQMELGQIKYSNQISQNFPKQRYVFQTFCPFCNRFTNVNEILKHLDVCPVKKSRTALSENPNRMGKILPQRDDSRRLETSIDRVQKSRQLRSYRLHKDLVENNSHTDRLQRGKKPQTERCMKAPLGTQKSDQGKPGYQLRFLTPMPLFLKVPATNQPYFKGIKPVGSQRQNAGRLARNVQVTSCHVIPE